MRESKSRAFDRLATPLCFLYFPVFNAWKELIGFRLFTALRTFVQIRVIVDAFPRSVVAECKSIVEWNRLSEPCAAFSAVGVNADDAERGLYCFDVHAVLLQAGVFSLATGASSPCSFSASAFSFSSRVFLFSLNFA